MSRSWRIALLAALGFAFASCDPSTVFIDPTGKTCTDPISPCPDGWACVPALDSPETICWPVGDAGEDDGGVDGGEEDSGVDSGVPDSGIKDSGVGDSGVKDSGVSDSGSPDSGNPGGDGGCTIGGKSFASGALNPADSCQQCEPVIATTNWSAVTAGTACDGGICSVGACVADCFIGGAVVDAGALNATNACQSCQPAASGTTYSNVANGTACGSSNLCVAGSCSSVCIIDGGFIPAAQANPGDPCQACVPSTSNNSWTVDADGTGCGTGEVCLSGACKTACYIGNQGLDAGTLDTSNACQSCQPDTSTSGFSNVPDGTGCGGSKLCSGGTCSNDCFIGNKIFTTGESNPANACQQCEPSKSNSSFTALATGASCGTGVICDTSGNCSADCDIGGSIVAANTPSPGNPCLACVPTTSTTAYSNAAAGTPCGGNNICAAGNCIFGCAVGSQAVDAGNSPLGNPCVICEPAVSTTAFVNLPNDAGCGSGLTCSNGICCGGSQGTLSCAGSPKDTCVDDLNCGYCGNACSNPNGCFAGLCGLPTSMPTARDSLAAATGPDGKIYAISGDIDATPTTTTVVEAFNPRTNLWTTETPIPVSVEQVGAIGAGNGVFVFGGYNCGPAGGGTNTCTNGTGTSEDIVQFLSTPGGTWSNTPTPPIMLSEPLVALGPSGEFFVPIGYSSTATLMFDPSGIGAGGSWSAGPTLPSAAVTYAPALTAGTNGTIYLINGSSNYSTTAGGFTGPSPDVYTLAPHASSWNALSSLIPTPRCALGAAADSAGNIYAIGGDNCAYCTPGAAGCPGYVIYDVTEIYDPTTQSWSTGPSLPNGVLTQFGTTVGLDGRIYVVGGWDGNADVSTLQIYDPVAGYWIP